MANDESDVKDAAPEVSTQDAAPEVSTQDAAPESSPTPVEDAVTEDSTQGAAPESSPSPKRSWLGVWAIALAVLGLLALPVLGSVLAVVLSRLALRRAPGVRVIGGRPLAITAFWIATATLAIITVAVTVYSLSTAFAGR